MQLKSMLALKQKGDKTNKDILKMFHFSLKVLKGDYLDFYAPLYVNI